MKTEQSPDGHLWRLKTEGVTTNHERYLTSCIS